MDTHTSNRNLPKVIVIGGPGASGCSTVAEAVAKETGFPRIYGGEVFRRLAIHLGMVTEQASDESYNRLADKTSVMTQDEFMIEVNNFFDGYIKEIEERFSSKGRYAQRERESDGNVDLRIADLNRLYALKQFKTADGQVDLMLDQFLYKIATDRELDGVIIESKIFGAIVNQQEMEALGHVLEDYSVKTQVDVDSGEGNLFVQPNVLATIWIDASPNVRAKRITLQKIVKEHTSAQSKRVYSANQENGASSLAWKDEITIGEESDEFKTRVILEEAALTKRFESDQARFEKLYGVKYPGDEYTLSLDTDNLCRQAVVETCVAFVQEKLEQSYTQVAEPVSAD